MTAERDLQDQPSTADLASAGTTPAAETSVRDDVDRSRGSERTTEVSPERFPEPPFDDRNDDALARGPLLGEDDLERYRSRWQTVQVRFVDEPRDTVKEADALVAELMQRLAQTFADERSTLESQWERGTDVSTEDLRVAMQRYRSFFDRLLAA